MKNLPIRSAVDQKETWNLEDLFKTEQEYEQSISDLEQMVSRFAERFAGNIDNPETINDALREYRAIMEKFVPVATYAGLATSVDQADDEAQMRESKLGTFAAKMNKALSFVDSELSALPVPTLLTAAEQSKDHANYLDKIIQKKPHQLHPEAEKTLAAFSATFQAPYGLYNITKLVDLAFDDFVVGGERYPLSYVTFEGGWESEPDTAKRRAAFQAFSDKLRDYQHTTAKTYDMHVQMEKTTADLRGYDTIFDYLLMDQEVDRSMYNRQIDLIMKELAPHMRKYAKLLQTVHGLETMTFADLKIPLDPTYEPKITFEESKKYMEEALSIMGDEYLSLVDRAYEDRWIDYAQNAGKSTGAFCSSPYGNHSYILISWTGSMEDVFVLAHELGHAGHFYYTNREQNIFNADPSLYFIEAPSTMNEMLMAQHLLRNSDDPKFKRWVIASIVSRTYYHNFVTHLLEAAYQRKVYERIDAGDSVNASILNSYKREVLEQFWGDAVEINEGAELTWMRQPHYYMGLYPYTYSAGLTISTQAAERILQEGQPAVEDWLNVLKAGGTKTPAELSKMAGVDITTDEPLKNTIAHIGNLIDELCELTKQIEGE